MAISDDGLTYTFTLNSNMTFANGHKLDSSDVVWSLQNVINNNYVGSDQLGSLKEITNPDEKTVVITLNQPNPCLLRALSGRAGIVYDEESTANYSKKAVGSGPFTVEASSKTPDRAAAQRLVLGHQSRRIANNAVLLRFRRFAGQRHGSQENQHGIAVERVCRR